MPRHVALVRETSCLCNLGNGQAAVQQQGSSKFHPALNNELMERYTYGAPKKRPGVWRTQAGHRRNLIEREVFCKLIFYKCKHLFQTVAAQNSVRCLGRVPHW
jgi:hypothetical protein